MIEGFKFHVTTNEARAHFTDRAKHHDAKSVEGEERLRAVTQAREVLKTSQNSTMAYGETADAVSRARKVIKYHRAKADGFRFLASHLPEAELFSVTPGDLQAFEFVPERPYGLGEDDCE